MTQVCTSRNHISPSDLSAYVAWLHPIPWQLFCTFTFAWPVSDSQAHKVFAEFINRLEKYIRGPIALIRGDEKRYSGCGMPGAPRHFHVLLTAHRQVDRQVVADLWMSMAGRRENGAGADVRTYNPTLGGLAYTLKFINQPNGDWALRNLDLFLVLKEPEKTDAKQRRRLARHAKRTQELTN